MKVGSLVLITVGQNINNVGLIISDNKVGLPNNHILKNYSVLVGDKEHDYLVSELEEIDVENWRSCRN